MEWLIRLVMIFFLYSIAGWCIEVTLKYIQYHRFINRGFLTGPVCPIYGSGAALITLAISGITPLESAVGTTFAVSFLLCGLLEYMTSFVMEKLFHARWWDYSQKPMNLHGRVWIGNLVLFGLGGVAIIHLINPLIDTLLALIPLRTQEIAAVCLAAVFSADFVMTQFVLKLVRSGIEHSEADNTEEMRREIRLLLSDKSVFYRRFADAYPEVIYRTERINARMAAVKNETERLRREAEQRIREQKQHITEVLEPASMIRGTIMTRQDQLIGMLYDEATATDEAKALKQAIDHDRERLESHSLRQITHGRK